MLHPRVKREFERDLKNIRQSLAILSSVENVKVTTFSLVGGGYNCKLSLGMLPKEKQETIISYIENVLETRKQYLISNLTKEKGNKKMNGKQAKIIRKLARTLESAVGVEQLRNGVIQNVEGSYRQVYKKLKKEFLNRKVRNKS